MVLFKLLLIDYSFFHYIPTERRDKNKTFFAMFNEFSEFFPNFEINHEGGVIPNGGKVHYENRYCLLTGNQDHFRVVD